MAGDELLTKAAARGVQESDAVSIREYRAGDDVGCRALEARASGQAPAWTKWFLDTQFINFAAFDARVKQFEGGGVTLVAVQRSEHGGEDVVGTICGAMKDMHFEGQKVPTCYLFDLRVAPESRRQRIGQRLSQEVERIVMERFGAKRIYLTVNADNDRARGLYEKLGYSCASTRAPRVENLLQKGSATAASEACEVLFGEQAAEALSVAAASNDGALSDYNGLVRSPNFLGVVRCGDGSSQAAVGVWDSAALNGFAISRLFVPSRWLFSPVGCLTRLGLVCIMPPLWGRYLWQLWLADRQISLSVAGVFTVGLLFAVAKVLPFVRVVGKVMQQSLQETPVAKLRGRLFAPWIQGPRGRELLRTAAASADGILVEKGFVMRIVNLDEEHPLSCELGPSHFFTLFMQKCLQPDDKPPSHWSPVSLHDPRDI